MPIQNQHGRGPEITLFARERRGKKGERRTDNGRDPGKGGKTGYGKKNLGDVTSFSVPFAPSRGGKEKQTRVGPEKLAGIKGGEMQKAQTCGKKKIRLEGFGSMTSVLNTPENILVTIKSLFPGSSAASQRVPGGGTKNESKH